MAGFVTKDELQKFIASTTDFQISTADFVSHTACIMRTLCNTVLDLGGILPSKALMVQQQLQLQALVLEVQQLQGKLSFASYANQTLQDQLLLERQLFCEQSVVVGEVEELRAENARLNQVCNELAKHKDDISTSTPESDVHTAVCCGTLLACSSTTEPIVDDDGCHILGREEIGDCTDKEEVSKSVVSTGECDSGVIDHVPDREDVYSCLEDCVGDGDSVCGKMASIYTTHTYNHDCDLVCSGLDVIADGTSDPFPSGSLSLMLDACFACFVEDYLDHSVRLPT